MEKSSTIQYTYAGDGCTVEIREDVTVRVTVPGGVQTINFPLTQLAGLSELIASALADDDVTALIQAAEEAGEPV